MPAKSEKQAIAARIARGIQKGEVKPKAGTASAQMAKMPSKSLKHFTETEAKMPDMTKLQKVIKIISKDVTDFQNYVGLDAPHDITWDTFAGIVMQDIKSPAIKAMWQKMDRRQQQKLFGLVVDKLYQKAYKEDPDYYGVDDDEKLGESSKLGNIMKEMQGKPIGMMLNGKKVNVKSIDIEDVDPRDYPDFVDAFISYAEYEDGTPLNDEELYQLTDQEGEWINSEIFDRQLYLEEGDYDWRDDPAMSRAWEKSDVSQDEFERHMGLAKQRPVAMSFKGITFFNVPTGKEQLAYEVGLRKLKSGKWGHKHQQTDTTADKEIIKRATQEFGQGRYWEPNK